MTVCEVKDFGRQPECADQAHLAAVTQASHPGAPRPRGAVRLEVKTRCAGQRRLVEQIVEAIISAARTGGAGDGKVS